MPLDADHNDAMYIWHMIEASRALVQITHGRTMDEVVAGLEARLALERAIEILGMAARRVSRETQARFPDIPWKKIIQQRHILAHEYDKLLHERLWRVATVHVPDLIPRLEAILPEPPPDPLPEHENTP